jgi:DNA-binding MarR family transcriptional regulator
MPRKVRLTPLQRDILWLLKEAGEETVVTVIASLRPLDRQAFDRAVEGLVRLAYITRSEWPKELGGSLLLIKAGERALTS